MENYDEKMNYSFEPVAPETPQPPLEQAKKRSGAAASTPDSRSRRCWPRWRSSRVSAAPC